MIKYRRVSEMSERILYSGLKKKKIKIKKY